MRALIFDKTLHLEHDVPVPTVANGEVLLRVVRGGICNTDLELMKGYMNFAGILGHEFVGVVEQGPDEWVGQRVVAEINVACGGCDFCERGIPSQCRNRSTVGINRYNGAFADYMRVPVVNLHRVPVNVSDDAAVFVEPLAAALQILEAVHVSPRDRVIVIGAGKLGLLVAQVLRLTGADLSVVVRRDKQRHLLETWGIEAVEWGRADDRLRDQSASVVVDCTGTADGFGDALRLVEPRGTIVLKSTYEGLPQANLTLVAVNEIRVVGSRCGPFPAALGLLSDRLVDVESLIEARYPLDDAAAAVEHAAARGALKILLDI